MQPRRLTSRAIHQEAKVDSNQQTYDREQMQRLENAADRPETSRFFLTEQTGINIENLVGLFRRMVLENGWCWRKSAAYSPSTTSSSYSRPPATGAISRTTCRRHPRA
jgi:hypothetical protein